MRLLSAVVLSLWFSLASAESFDADFDYAVMPEAVNMNQPGKVVVTELFWYGCPHCFRFEPLVNKWKEKLPENVVFQQLPSTLNPRWSAHARTYYALKLMGMTEKTHGAIFNEIHVNRGNLNSYSRMVSFLKPLGVDVKEFEKHYNSFEVETQLRRDRNLEKKSGATGVPAVVINGKYRTGGAMAGNYERLLRIVDHLVDEELKAIETP